MTSFAFIFGVLPLAISTGAGANSRIAIGTVGDRRHADRDVLAIFYIPLFFVLVRRGVRDGLDVRPRAHPPAAARRRHEARRRTARAARRPAARRWSRRYVRPDPAVPASWPAGDAYLAPDRSRASGASPTSEIFRDPRLQTLIAQALANNRDLMVAAANIAAAREQYRIQRADQLPQVDASGRRDASGDKDDTVSAQLSGRAQRPELRARPVRPAALADPRPARALSRDRGRRARRPGWRWSPTSPTPGSTMPRTRACC